MEFIEKFEYKLYFFAQKYLKNNNYLNLKKTFFQSSLQKLDVYWQFVKVTVSENDKNISIIYENDRDHTLGVQVKHFQDKIENALAYLKYLLDSIDDYRFRQELELMSVLPKHIKYRNLEIQVDRNRIGKEEKDFCTVIDVYFNTKSMIQISIYDIEIEVSIVKDIDDYYFSTPPIDYSSYNINEVFDFIKQHPIFFNL